MSADREVNRIVRSWLEEGVTALPDRVLDAVLDQVPATSQRRALWPAWRLNEMNNPLKLAIAGAAVVVVALVGINLLPRSGAVGGPGSGPTSNPPKSSPSTQTPAASPSPSPSAGPPIGSLVPGTYVVDYPSRTPVRFTFTVPAGWVGRADGSVDKNLDQPNELGFIPFIVTHVYADACHSEGALKEVGPTVDDLVRALVDQVGSDASAPVDVTLGGYPAKRIDMSIPAELDTLTCRYPGSLIQIWADPAETGFFAIPVDPANPAADQGGGGRVYIADVNGDRAVIHTGSAPGASTSDIAELEGVIDSIRFESPASPSPSP